MTIRIGTQPGIFRRATIRKYNGDGTVTIALNDVSLSGPPQNYIVPLSSTWMGPGGEFVGGYPTVGSTVTVSQGESGQWFIVSYIPSDGVFDTEMSALKQGRALIQAKGGNRIFAHPAEGIQAGNDANFLHIDPDKSIISHNFKTDLKFTESSRSISGVIKRDLYENSNREVLFSVLDSQNYESSLFSIGLDPTIKVSSITAGQNIRNPPLVENRELIYEFAQSYEFTTDSDEGNRYTDPNSGESRLKASRRNNRTDTLSLSLEHPNHLIESIKGTVVDTFGNVLDLNRNPLPIGKNDLISLKKNPDKENAFAQIRAQMRRSLAFHWEQNSRKGEDSSTVSTPRDVDSTADYARKASRFFIDIDKEGQFKINVPSSSEIGNVPLLTRYENYSVVASKKDKGVHPNSFIKGEDGQEILLENFASKPSIVLKDGSSEGGNVPIDRITETPIKLGTAYHDITKTLSEFTSSASYLQAGAKLINFDKNNPLNSNFSPLSKVVSDTITISGKDANAGGRSGMINLDGFISLNIGANTVDRQSLWLDTAGGIMANIGRDKRGISYGANLDGDMFIQIGGPGIGNSFDSRFSSENDAYRNGTLDVRVFLNGQMMIFRMGPQGITIASPGTVNITSQQDMIFRSNGSMKFEAENIVLYAETEKRLVRRFPADSI